MRRGRVFYDRRFAGTLEETESGMRFTYTPEWLADPAMPSISRTLPKRVEPYESRGPHPFFMGLLPEGWLHDIGIAKLRIAVDDAMGQILNLCRDCVGAVHVEPEGDLL